MIGTPLIFCDSFKQFACVVVNEFLTVVSVMRSLKLVMMLDMLTANNEGRAISYSLYMMMILSPND